MRLSLLKSLVLSSVAFLWIFASGLALSFVPKVTWLSSPKIEPNSYTGVGLSQRLLEIFHKWDAKIYTDLALNGYPSTSESWAYAFFPGWPKILGAMAQFFSITDPRATLYLAVGLNLLLCTLALWCWSRLLPSELPSRVRKGFILLLLLYPTSIFYFTSYPEMAVVALSGICALAVSNSSFRMHLIWAIPLLISVKHAGISLGLAFPLWSLIKTKRFDWLPWFAWATGIGIVLWFYFERSGNAFAWLDAQKAWGRSWGWPWKIWMDLHRKGVELVLYVFWLFAAPVWLFLRAGNLRGFLTGKNEYGLFFLMVSSIFVPLWFGSSTASIYRIILLGVPALLLPVTFVCKQPRWVRIFSLLLLILLNLHATYRYVASLYLA